MPCKRGGCHDWPCPWYLLYYIMKVALPAVSTSGHQVAAKQHVFCDSQRLSDVNYGEYCVVMLHEVKNLNATFIWQWLILFLTQTGRRGDWCQSQLSQRWEYTPRHCHRTHAPTRSCLVCSQLEENLFDKEGTGRVWLTGIDLRTFPMRFTFVCNVLWFHSMLWTKLQPVLWKYPAPSCFVWILCVWSLEEVPLVSGCDQRAEASDETSVMVYCTDDWLLRWWTNKASWWKADGNIRT